MIKKILFQDIIFSHNLAVHPGTHRRLCVYGRYACLEVSKGPSFSKLNLSVSHLSFLSVWNNVMISDFNFKILGRKIRKGKWKKRGKKWKDRP